MTQIKSTSAFGMAVIYVYFKDSTDIYFARQLVGERLASVMAELPETDEPPALGPISTGLGQIFLYYLEADPDVVDTGGKPLDTWLRELNDWVVKFQLQTVPGVTDILSIGGHVLQYQIRVNPNALLQVRPDAGRPGRSRQRQQPQRRRAVPGAGLRGTPGARASAWSRAWRTSRTSPSRRTTGGPCCCPMWPRWTTATRSGAAW